jgi:pimeloyl-ACP methyl ester carboxylesterase
MPFVDTSRIFLVGYSLGGTVALVTAALDQRVKGVAAACAFSSWRSDTAGTEGIRRFYDIEGLLPRLGLFSGDKSRIPVDFDGILSCIAPRPLLLITPTQDRDHTIGAVRKITHTVAGVYTRFQAGDQLTVEEPVTFNHFTEGMQQRIISWLKRENRSGE